MGAFDKIRSGISGLDEALDYIRLGDNVVWQISDLEEFRTFAEPFARQAVADGRNVIYIRFAQHKPVLRDISGIRVSNLDRPGVTMLTSVEQRHKFSQRDIDLLNCGGNRLTELPLDALLPQLPLWYKKMVLERDYEAESRLKEIGRYREGRKFAASSILAGTRPIFL